MHMTYTDGEKERGRGGRDSLFLGEVDLLTQSQATQCTDQLNRHLVLLQLIGQQVKTFQLDKVSLHAITGSLEVLVQNLCSKCIDT